MNNYCSCTFPDNSVKSRSGGKRLLRTCDYCRKHLEGRLGIQKKAYWEKLHQCVACKNVTSRFARLSFEDDLCKWCYFFKSEDRKHLVVEDKTEWIGIDG